MIPDLISSVASPPGGVNVVRKGVVGDGNGGSGMPAREQLPVR